MRTFLIIHLLFFAVCMYPQQHSCAAHKQRRANDYIRYQQRQRALVPQISHELKYDVKFVHLDLNMERNTAYVSGQAKTVARVSAASLDTFQTLLHQNFTIDSVKINGSVLSFTRKDSLVKAKPLTPLANGASFTVAIWYSGTAPTVTGSIGSGYTYTTVSWGNQVSWSLSEPFSAHHWWPCKQILTDKIDSSWVFVTTDSANKVGSNGRLTNVISSGSKKRYEWKSRSPIDYYLISVAISNYKEYNAYAKPLYLGGDSILVQNYIYANAINHPSWQNLQKPYVDKIPGVINLLSNLYGMYPFYKEKYGNCMTGFSGGMEHQTMTSIGFFNNYYLNVHELAHQWWGNHVTCKSWADIWINEGFAVYSEFVAAQYLEPLMFSSAISNCHNYVMSQPGGSVHFIDTLNPSRIFDGRLSYNKGGAILHTLRFITNNDSLWFNTLRGFQNTYKNNTASAGDFKSYYELSTGINATQFFDQWYYGEGYPTFDVKYYQSGNICFIQSTQSVSAPGSVQLFTTPIEYKIIRSGASDTIVRVIHSNVSETYTFELAGTVTGVICDPNNWLINKTIGPALDPSIGFGELCAETDNITLGPNPTTFGVRIKNPSGIALQVAVYDSKGCKLSSSAQESVDLSSYPSGIYLIKVTAGIGEKVFRVVKE